jgi:DNA-directed RNA polymerase specialized sigma subunit
MTFPVDNSDRDAIVHHYMPLVKQVARRYRGLIEYEDAVQEGSIGLLRAIDTYQRNRGSFAAHAGWCIRGAITAAIAKNNETVRLPSHVLRFRYTYRVTIARLWQVLHRDPTIEEIAHAMGVTVALIRRRMSSMVTTVAMDDDLQSPSPPPPPRTTRPIPNIPSPYREVIRHRYEDGLSLRATAEMLGWSTQRVRKTEQAALAVVRQQFEVTYA